MLRERAEVSVFCLAGDQFIDDRLDLFLQLGVCLHAACLDGGNQVFSDKFAGPRDQLGRRLAIAQAKHGEHAGIRGRCAQQPIRGVGGNPFPDHTTELKVSVWIEIEE